MNKNSGWTKNWQNVSLCRAAGKHLVWMYIRNESYHGLRTPGEEIVFTARTKINSHSQIFRCGRSIFCLLHRPKFSDFFDLCLHWVSVVRESYNKRQEAFLVVLLLLQSSYFGPRVILRFLLLEIVRLGRGRRKAFLLSFFLLHF